jgi:hypothetical protein
MRKYIHLPTRTHDTHPPSLFLFRKDLLASRRISMHKKHIVKEKRQENASKLMDDLMQTGQLVRGQCVQCARACACVAPYTGSRRRPADRPRDPRENRFESSRIGEQDCLRVWAGEG